MLVFGAAAAAAASMACGEQASAAPGEEHSLDIHHNIGVLRLFDSCS